MNKFFLAFALFAFSLSTVAAQRGSRSEHRQGVQQRIQQQLQRTAQQLDLSDAQVAGLQSYIETQAPSWREQLQAAEPETKRELARSFSEDFRNQLEDVLTPAQLEQLQEMKADRQQTRQHRREEARQRHQERRQDIAQELELNEPQKESIKAYREEQNEARKSELEAAETREERQAIKRRYAEAYHTHLRSLLNDEQLQKMEAICEENREARSSRRQGQRSQRGYRRGDRQ